MTKFSDYFNSTTIRGRANVAKATYASFAALYLYRRFQKRKNKSTKSSLNNATDENNAQKLQDHGNIQCPCCETYTEKETEVHEATPSLDSDACNEIPVPNTQPKQDTSVAESIISSSKSKCESGCNATNPTAPETGYEQKSDDIKCVYTCHIMYRCLRTKLR